MKSSVSFITIFFIFLLNIAAAFDDTALVAADIENHKKEEEITNFEKVLQKQIDEVFRPTNEWQDIKPGQTIPRGLHVRLDLATGRREAKNLYDEKIENKVESEREREGRHIHVAHKIPAIVPNVHFVNKSGELNSVLKSFFEEVFKKCLPISANTISKSDCH